MLDIENPESESLIKELLQVLTDIPFIRDVRPEQADANYMAFYHADLHIKLTIADEPLGLVVETKARALYPRDIRELLWQLKNIIHLRSPNNLFPIIIARSISPAARRLLEENNIGYFVSGGSLRLSTSNAFIYIDRPTPKRATKKDSAVFKGRKSDILRVLLGHPDRWFGVNEIAELAGTAASTASEALSLLEKKEWLAIRGAGPNKERKLRKASIVLDEWKDDVKRRPPIPKQQFFVRAKSNAELCKKLFAHAAEYQATLALTSQTAANFYAPLLTSTPQVYCRALVNAAFRNSLQELSASPVPEGGNLIILPTKSSGAFILSEEHDGMTYASPLQTYLDLLQSGGRSAEAAEHLREIKLSRDD